MPTRQSSEIMAISPGAHMPLSKYERFMGVQKAILEA
jgi:hypothetical protein